MKKKSLIIIVIIAIILIGVFWKLDSDLDKLIKTDIVEHSLNEKRLIIIYDSISPNEKHRYFEYHFDNGALGYSRVFWSVIVNDSKITNLESGILPDGYKTIGWGQNNELIVKKWTPYYSIDNKIYLESGSEYNGVKLKIE